MIVTLVLTIALVVIVKYVLFANNSFSEEKIEKFLYSYKYRKKNVFIMGMLKT